MAVEYSSQSNQINFPNPLRIHNRFIFLGSAILLSIGIFLLVDVRNNIENGARFLSYQPLAISVALIGSGVFYLYKGLSQLRFYFGRGRPRGLAPTLKDGERGTTSAAQDLIKETLRQQAIEYLEPRGPISGALYSMIPNLIYAPQPLRYYAEWQFRGLIILISFFVGIISTLLIGMPISHNQNLPDWIGISYLFLTIGTLVRPGSDAVANGANNTFLSVKWVSILITSTIVGPVAISALAPSLPPVPYVNPYPHVFIFIICGIIIHGLFFVSIFRQLLPPPATAVSMIQDTWNLSAHPAVVTGEFLRAMQEDWPEKIPNRRYTHIEPNIDLTARAGSFSAEVIEETQPFPVRITKNTESHIFSSVRPAFVLALDAVGLAFLVAGAFSVFLLGQRFMSGGDWDKTLSLYAAFFWSMGVYGLNGANRLWLRFDFISRLIWLEMSGQYIAAQIDQGNTIQGTLRASSSMVQVEGMTFRLWQANVHTVSFGKDARRYIVSMVGNPEAAETLALRLKKFAMNQASVAALGNIANAQRLAVNATLSQPVASTAITTTAVATGSAPSSMPSEPAGF